MKENLIDVPIGEIIELFGVRIELNQGHLNYLGGLLDEKVELPPLLISTDKELINGRHRIHLYKVREYKTVKCDMQHFESLADKIVAALGANVGGSLPPTESDISHTMKLLLEADLSRKEIIEKVSAMVGFPKGLVKRHLDNVQSNLAKARLKKAVNAVVNDGVTVPTASATFGVRLDALKAAITGKGTDDSVTVAQLKSHFTASATKFGLVIGQNLGNLARGLGDGANTEDEVQEVMSHVEKLFKRLNGRHNEWKTRFKSQGDSTAAAVEKSRNQARKPRVQRGQSALGKMGLQPVG